MERGSGDLGVVLGDAHELVPVLVADPRRALEVPADRRMMLLDAIGVAEVRLRAVRDLVIASFLPTPTATTTVIDHGGADVIDDVAEVAQLVRRSVSWVRKRGRELPGFMQPGGRGRRVAWKRSALLQYASGSTAQICLDGR